ncbi:MAG: hypothetical protein JXR60_06885 [Bacteroidales bacterium]|nr:hypothetical protein [Bacteroidales bacterium]
MKPDKHELFKKRWERYQKMGAIKYGLFLGFLYAFVLFSVSLLFDFKNGDLPIDQILTYINTELLLKTGFFLVFGFLFGLYHFKKSQKKYQS